MACAFLRRERSCSGQLRAQPRPDAGGVLCVCARAEFFNDIWRFDLESIAWTNLSPFASGTPPIERYGPGFTALEGKLVVFGGFGGSFPDGRRLRIRSFAGKRNVVRCCLLTRCGMPGCGGDGGAVGVRRERERESE
eukprot:3523506-Rhodomonas_salina.1